MVVCGAPWLCVGRRGCVWGAVVVCGARWLCVGRGGCVWGAVVVCGGAVDVCGALWLCVGRGAWCVWGAGTFGREVWGSNPPAVVFKTWAISFTPLCLCFSEETLKAVGPFYIVSMPGEVKYD